MEEGVRRLCALVHGLPPEFATWRNDTDPWTQTDHFLAALIENGDHWGRQNAVLHGVKQQQLPKPVRIPRPGETEPERQIEKDPRAIAAWFSRFVNEGG